MTKEQAVAKYGDTKVMVIDLDDFQRIYTKYETKKVDGDNCIQALMDIDDKLKPMLRCEAEFDPSYLQVIPYTVIVSHDTDVNADKDFFKVFTTHRIDGDSRLVGQYSIGTGGHIDDGELVIDGLVRELYEEVGLYEPEDGFDLTTPILPHDFFIYDPSNEVSSVHLGLVFFLYVDWSEEDDIKVAEPEKLEGEWMTVDELMKLVADGRMETWSVDVLTRLANMGLNINIPD